MEFQLKIFISHYKFYFFQEEDLSKLVECMALNSNSTSSESESEVSEVSQNILEDDSLLVTIFIKQTGTISSKTYKLRISSCRVFRKEGQKVLKVFFFQVDSFLIDEASQEASLTGSEAEPEFLLSSVR